MKNTALVRTFSKPHITHFDTKASNAGDVLLRIVVWMMLHFT